MKCFLYILENKKGKHYTGITKLEPKQRLLRHNKGEVDSTKFGSPWSLIYFQEYKDYKEAREKEKQIKSWHGGDTLKRFLGKTAGSSNGRTHPSGGWYLGSSPKASPPLAESPKQMNFIYVLTSISHNNRYVGVTENLEKRLFEHNSGKCRYTKGRMPWKIIYTENFSSLGLARRREIFLKSGQGRKWLDENIREKN